MKNTHRDGDEKRKKQACLEKGKDNVKGKGGNSVNSEENKNL